MPQILTRKGVRLPSGRHACISRDQHWSEGGEGVPNRGALRRAGVVALVLVLLAGLLLVGVVVWQRLHRTDLEKAVEAVPASS
jgi:hypothetical protein